MTKSWISFIKQVDVVDSGDFTMIDTAIKILEVLGIVAAGESLVNALVNILPSLALVIILAAIGYWVGVLLKKLIIKILQSTPVDQWVDEQNLSAAIGGQEISAIAGSLVKWWIIFVFLQQAANLIELEVLDQLLGTIVWLIPSALKAIIVIVAGLLAGRWVRNIIEATQHKLKKTVGIGLEIIIVVFFGIMGLSFVVDQYNVETLIELIKIFVGPFITAFAWVLAIVIGVGIGLAYKKELLGIGQTLKKGLK